MLKIVLLLGVCFVILSTGECGLSNLLHRKTTTEQPEITTIVAKDGVPAGYYKSNNLPQVKEGCEIRFECKKKLKSAETPKPCTKFCVKSIKCEDGTKINGAPGQCIELNEEMVAQEYNDCKKDEEESGAVNVMKVAMIDFPCQPGYLPDSRGRCREVW
ncbi:uncharacterized protein LOC119608870 [Lucilia sericata]|uniref:uncharacterized protein LOC119608870 n=1 Tax=Lucilia sericata TaxID=13632 RepID=UPI0018A83EDE|nr:uncharacterized protein LOC119608870 [Lucilia sericata]